MVIEITGISTINALNNKGCCCPKCYTRDGASVAAADCPICCSCVPKTACVTAYSTAADNCGDTLWESGVIFAGTRSTWCDPSNHAYSGVLIDATLQQIDYSISFAGSGTGCKICLESTALGYSGEDNCILMGSGEAKKSGCILMEYDFPISLTGLDASCDSGVLRLRPFDAVNATGLYPPTGCFMDKACIYVSESGFVGIDNSGNLKPGIYSETLCFSVSGSTSGWFTEMNDDPNKWVNIILNDYSPASNTPPSLTPTGVSLRVESYIGSGIIQDAGFCPKMAAKWENSDSTAFFTSGYENGIIKITGDERRIGRQSKTDTNNIRSCSEACSCWCRCLCFKYSNDTPPYTLESTGVCSESGRWEVSFASGDFNGIITLDCSGCQTLSPYLTLVPSGSIGLVSAASQSVICPDRLEAQWSVTGVAISGTATITAECLDCDGTCPAPGALGCNTDCCENPIPLVLYGTVENTVGCPELSGVTITFTNVDDLITGGCSDCWEGSHAGCDFSLRCGYAGGSDWTLDTTDCFTHGGQYSITESGCDPFELLFNIYGAGCCTDTMGATFDIRITE
jgi:hypothetical protein